MALSKRSLVVEDWEGFGPLGGGVEPPLEEPGEVHTWPLSYRSWTFASAGSIEIPVLRTSSS